MYNVQQHKRLERIHSWIWGKEIWAVFHICGNITQIRRHTNSVRNGKEKRKYQINRNFAAFNKILIIIESRQSLLSKHRFNDFLEPIYIFYIQYTTQLGDWRIYFIIQIISILVPLKTTSLTHAPKKRLNEIRPWSRK